METGYFGHIPVLSECVSSTEIKDMDSIPACPCKMATFFPEVHNLIQNWSITPPLEDTSLT